MILLNSWDHIHWDHAWLKWLEDGLPLCQPRLDPTLVHVRFVIDKVAMRQVFLSVVWFHPASQSTNAQNSYVIHPPPMQYNLNNRQHDYIQHSSHCHGHWIMSLKHEMPFHITLVWLTVLLKLILVKAFKIYSLWAWAYIFYCNIFFQSADKGVSDMVYNSITYTTVKRINI